MLVNSDDYRLGSWESELIDLKKYDQLFTKMKDNCIVNYYKNLSNNSGEYKMSYLECFHFHCAYCGLSMELFDRTKFQIDHICSRKPKDNNYYNLAPACTGCNGSKSDSFNDIKILGEFSPLGNLKNVFERLDDFSICIKDKYKNNVFALKLYSDLKLGNSTKRIDFALLCLSHFFEICTNDKMKSDLSRILTVIKRLRSNLY